MELRQALDGALRDIASEALRSSGRSTQQATAVLPAWKAASWLLDDTELHKVFAAALTQPLLAEATRQASPVHDRVEFGYMQRLGKISGRRDVISCLLYDAFDSLVDEIDTAVGRLTATKYATAGELLSDKFQVNKHTMKVGNFSAFHAGLEGLIGRPSPSLDESVQREHSDGPDAHDAFRTSNFEMTTTSEIEWFFVASPGSAPATFKMVPEFLAAAAASAAPAALPAASASAAASAAAPSHALNFSEWHAAAHEVSVSGWPVEKAGGGQRRRPLPPTHFEADLREKNLELARMGVRPLQRVEIVATRMYTGPSERQQTSIARECTRGVERWLTLCGHQA